MTSGILYSFVPGTKAKADEVNANFLAVLNKIEETNSAKLNVDLSNIDETSKNRSYVQNKKNFNLYWNLEALAGISDKVVPTSELQGLLEKTALSNDYTIREKTAKVAYLFSSKNSNFKKIIELLKDDNNIYVKKFVDE